MPFTPPRSIPGLKSDASRVLLAALNGIGLDLTQALSSGLRATAVQFTSGLAQLGQLILCAPPAAGMTVLLPIGTLQNRGQVLQVGILTVASGGSVIVSVVGSAQTVNDAATLTLSSPGVTEFTSAGPNGWLATGAGGGGGLVPPVALADIQQITGPTLLGRLAGLGTILELTPAQANTILPVFTALLNGSVPASGGGAVNFLRADGTWAAPGGGGGGTATDATATLPFAGKRSDAVTIVDASLLGTTKLVINWGSVADTDENTPEDNPVIFTATPAVGSFSLRITTGNPQLPVGGAYKIRYQELT